MTITINGRTPEEIKRGLECCMCIDCPSDCPYVNCDEDCNVVLNNDAIACIKYFEDKLREAAKKIEQLECERDAAVKDIPRECHKCKHLKVYSNGCPFDYDCDRSDNCIDNDNWQWRGVEVE